MVSVKDVLKNRVVGNMIQKDHLCGAFTCKFHYFDSTASCWERF